jgi:hypothetical protein
VNGARPEAHAGRALTGQQGALLGFFLLRRSVRNDVVRF